MFNRLLACFVIPSEVVSMYLFILSFSFYKIEIFVFNLMFYYINSLTVCFNCKAYEYNLYLSWWIFLGRILAKSWVVKSGFIILICFLLAFLLATLWSPISSELAWPQYPLYPGLADCGLNSLHNYLFIF